MYCDCCKTSIFDLHRSCPSCHYDLCLQCCWELRDGNLQGNKDKVVFHFEDPGSEYLFGGPLEDVKRLTRSSASAAPKDKQFFDSMSAADPAPKEPETHDGLSVADLSPKEVESHDWMSLDDGRIPCPPQRQPVIVSNVLETTLGLSWEPMVMWRAFRQIANVNHDTLLDVSALDCLDWCERTTTVSALRIAWKPPVEGHPSTRWGLDEDEVAC
nr:hypothetical protein [Tanacetum cinerariifolium]